MALANRIASDMGRYFYRITVLLLMLTVSTLEAGMIRPLSPFGGIEWYMVWYGTRVMVWYDIPAVVDYNVGYECDIVFSGMLLLWSSWYVILVLF